MDGKKYILSDEAIRDLTDTTPFSEGDSVGFLEDGDGCGFWLAAEEFREDLEAMKPENFRRLCALLGLSVPWENERLLRRRRKT